MSDEDLLAQLRGMWSAIDPPPAGLVDEVLLALATELDADVELLALLEPDPFGAAVRGQAVAETLRFALDGVEVLLRLAGPESGRRRVDGWLAPSGAGLALLRTPTGVLEAVVAPTGRFEFPAVPPGLLTLELRLDAGPRRLRTPPFPL